MIAINADAIPNHLRSLPQWLMWRYENKNGKKPTKVPYQPNGHHAKSNDPTTWCDFGTCFEALKQGKFDGIGFAFAEGNGLTGVDLDDCLNADGKPEEWARAILDQFTLTYIEQSPSGKGFHIIGLGNPFATGSQKWKKAGTNEDQGIEVYDYTSPRYFTVTGNSINKQDITDCQPALDWLHSEYWPEQQLEEPKQARDANGQVNLPLVKEALSFILSDDYQMWIDIGLALKVSGVAFEVWDQWGQTSSKYVADESVKKWSTFKDNRNGKTIGLGTLFYHAKQNGFKFQNDPSKPPDWTNPETFGEPILFGDVNVPNISLDFLPSIFKDYALAVADFTQTPPEAVALLMLAILAACLQKKFIVSPYNDDYIEPLSIWILIILFSGERKTAIVKALCDPISEWENKKADEMRIDLEKAKTQREIAEGRIEKLTKDAISAKEDSERNKIEDDIQNIRDNIPAEKLAPQIYTSNVTPEALEDLLVEHNEAMSVISDEADALMEILTGLYSDGRANLDVFLKGHAGSSHRVNRQKRKALLKSPAVTMGLTAQPDVLERISADGRKKRLRGVGLLARFDYGIPKPMIGTRKPRERKSIDPVVKARYYQAVTALLDYPCPETPARLTISKDGREPYVAFQEWLEPKMAPFAEFGDMSDWASKATGGVVRIAGLIHIADQVAATLSTKSTKSLEKNSQGLGNGLLSLNIGKTTVDKAIALKKTLITHASKALDIANNDQGAADAKWALAWILRNAKQDDTGAYFFKENDLHKSSRFKNSSKRERLDKALASLEIGERNIISKQFKLTTKKPTLIRYGNPAIFSNFILRDKVDYVDKVEGELQDQRSLSSSPLRETIENGKEPLSDSGERELVVL